MNPEYDLYAKKLHTVQRVQSDSLGAPGRQGHFYCVNCSATAQEVLELIGKACTPSKPTRKPYAKCQEPVKTE